jgi:hypothetical protein
VHAMERDERREQSKHSYIGLAGASCVSEAVALSVRLGCHSRSAPGQGALLAHEHSVSVILMHSPIE